MNQHDYPNDEAASRELRMTQCVSSTNRRHRGYQFVRALQDSFYLEGPDGRHVCMVFDTLKEPLWNIEEALLEGCFAG